MTITKRWITGDTIAQDEMNQMLSDHFGNWVVTGLLVTDNGGLSVAISAGNARISGRDVAEDGSTLTTTDNSTNYIWLVYDGTYHQDTDNSAPSDPYVYLATVTTSGGDITEVVDKRHLYEKMTKNVSICNSTPELALFTDDQTRIVRFRSDGTDTLLNALGDIIIDQLMRPSADNTKDLGESSYQWRTGYLGTSLIIGTDVNLYRASANVGKSDDTWSLAALQIGGTEVISSGRALENIVSLNTSLVPDTDNSYDIGSLTKQLKDLYVNGLAYIDGLGEDLDIGANKLVFTDINLYRLAADVLGMGSGDKLGVDEVLLDATNRDVRLYRGSANVLKTPDSVDVLALRIDGTEVLTGTRGSGQALRMMYVGDETEKSVAGAVETEIKTMRMVLNASHGRNYSRIYVIGEAYVSSGTGYLKLSIDGAASTTVWTISAGSYTLYEGYVDPGWSDGTVHTLSFRLVNSGAGTTYNRTLEVIVD